MDIDFSQVGQNIASFGLEQNVSRVPVEQKEVTAESKNSSKTDETVNASKVSADNKTEADVSKSSVNIETAVAEISDFVQAQNRQLAFSIDEKSQRSVVKVTDAESGDVIRQIPSEEVLKLSERIKDLQSDVGAAVGILFNKQA